MATYGNACFVVANKSIMYGSFSVIRSFNKICLKQLNQLLMLSKKFPFLDEQKNIWNICQHSRDADYLSLVKCVILRGDAETVSQTSVTKWSIANVTFVMFVPPQLLQ